MECGSIIMEILVKECSMHNLVGLARRNIYFVCKMLYYYIIFDGRARDRGYRQITKKATDN